MEARKCLILDDSTEANLALENCLNKIGFFYIKSVNRVNDAISHLKTEKFDLLFLDIELEEGSGIDFLQSYPNLPPAIIISSHPKYAIETYDIENIVDFLQKPYSGSRLQRAINRAIGNTYMDNAYIEKDFAFLKVARKIQRFAYDDIDYIEAYGSYSKIYKNGKFTLVNESISALEQSLPTLIFRRIHKSYIISFKKITGYDHKYFFVNLSQIPIGSSYKESLQGLFRIFGNELIDEL